MKLHKQKTDFSTMYTLTAFGRDWLFGFIAMPKAITDAETYGLENVNDRLSRENPTPEVAAYIKTHPHLRPTADGTALEDNPESGVEAAPLEHPLAAYDPFAQGPLKPRAMQAALDRIHLEFGTVCTNACMSKKCKAAKNRMEAAING